MKKDINNIHDKSYKSLYSNKEIFLDLIKEMLDVPWSKNLNPDDLILVNKSYITSDYEEKESDIVYRANVGNAEVIFYVLLEFQSTVDYRMPLRLFFYISEILREYAKNANHKANDKNVKVPAVIPIVLYNGNSPWDAAKSFRKIVSNEELFGDSIIDFRYNLFDVNNEFTKEDLLKHRTITSAIFLLDQKIKPIEFLQRIKAIALFFNNLNEKEIQVLKHWIENSVQEELAEEAIKILSSSKEEVEKMVSSNAFILTEMEEEAKRKGKEEGLKEGKVEILMKLLLKKFKKVPQNYLDKIKKLPIETVELITIEILDMDDIKEIEKYL